MSENRNRKRELVRNFRNDIHKKFLFTAQELNALTGYSEAFWSDLMKAGKIKVCSLSERTHNKVTRWALIEFLRNNETFLSRSQQ
jgi:hypothetical protein